MSLNNGWYYFSKYLIQLGLFYFTALLPLQPTFLPASPGIMIAGIGWIMMFFAHRHKITFNLYAGWVVAFFILYYLSGIDFFSKSKNTAELLSVQIPLLFWGLPFVFYYKELQNSFFQHLQKIFVLSCVLSALIFLVNFLLIELQNIPLEYSKRSPYYFLPVHYLGMYFNVALTFLLFGKTFRHKSLTLSLSTLLITSVILLSVRMQWIILAVLLIAYTLDHIRFFFTGRKFLYLLLGIIVIITTVIFSPEVNRRIQETIDEFRSIKTKKNGKQTNHRIFIWKEAVDLCRNVPLSGFKPGTADSLLMARLELINAEFWDGEKIYYLRDGSYNFHNQFLQALAERGIGVLFLLAALVVVFYTSIHPASKYVVLVIALSMLTESILQRQAGVFLVAYFLPFLALFSKKSDAQFNA